MKNLTKSCIILLILTFLFPALALAQSDENEHSIKFLNDQTAQLVGDNGAILKTTDGGTTWADQNSGVANALFSNYMIDNTTSMIVGENGLIMKTVDDGATWKIKDAGVFANLNKIETNRTNGFIVVGDSGLIIKSVDLGETWTIVNSGTTNNLNSVKNFFGGIIYAIGENSTILRSSDDGDTWGTVEFTAGSYNFLGIGAADLSNIILIGDGDVILRTTDQGTTWLGIGQQTGTTDLDDIVMFTSTTGVIVGDDGFAVYTIDGGISWQQSMISTLLASPTSRDLEAVSFSSFTTGIVVGEMGTHYYTTDGGANWSSVKPVVKPNFAALKNKEFKVNQNYPNPFNPSTVISYTLPFDGNVSVKIYDMLGKEVATLTNSFEKSGDHNTTFNASALASGIYFYRLIAENGSNKLQKTMRMILTK